MQIVRTILWVLLAVVLVLFAINNWQTVEVRIWNSLILETRLAALTIAAFLLGLAPMWLLHRTVRWRFFAAARWNSWTPSSRWMKKSWPASLAWQKAASPVIWAGPWEPAPATR